MASVATCPLEDSLGLQLPQHLEFRKQMRSLRQAVPPELAAEATRAVKQLLLDEPVIQEASSIAVYAATDGEVDVSDIATWAQENAKRVFFPAMRHDIPLAIQQEVPKRTKPTRIAFVEWLPGANWIKGAFNIPEPAGGEEISIEDCDTALVPGVAFDRNANRIGRGKGYYDKALAFLAQSTRPRPPVLFGVCHDFQIVDEMATPITSKDIHMDAIVSPSGIIWKSETQEQTSCA